MKKILLTTTGLIALGMAPAFAADLGARTYTKAPAPVAINSWAGFYIGAMGGYAQENTSDVGALSGGFAGGTVGYNWQSGNLVLGVEADAAWTDIGATVGIVGLASASDKIRDMGTVRGRIGYAFDQVLVYGTGGYAWIDNRHHRDRARREHLGQPLPFRMDRQAPVSRSCSHRDGRSRPSTFIAASKARTTSPLSSRAVSRPEHLI